MAFKQNKFVLFMISMSLSTRVTFFEGKSIFLYYSDSLSPWSAASIVLMRRK